jgi:putative Mg2+ transporter-C (MgtC) family protein
MSWAVEAFFYDLGEPGHLTRILVRLGVALVLGTIVGWEREAEGKRAGLRTHMLVALGAGLFVIVPLEAGNRVDLATGVQTEHITRVIQGIVTGIGFLGAGTILKLTDQREVKGLTTAASIWLTAAVGMSAGAGWLWPAVAGTILALVILFFLQGLERWIRPRPPRPPTQPPAA